MPLSVLRVAPRWLGGFAQGINPITIFKTGKEKEYATPKTITQEELQNLLGLVMTITTYRDELIHRVKAGARIERAACTVRKYPPSWNPMA
jgi:hypothetical protein